MQETIDDFEEIQLKLLILSDYIFSRFYDDDAYYLSYNAIHNKDGVDWDSLKNALRGDKEQNYVFQYLNRWGTRISYDASKAVYKYLEKDVMPVGINKLSKDKIAKIFDDLQKYEYIEINEEKKTKRIKKIGPTAASKLLNNIYPNDFPIIDSIMRKEFIHESKHSPANIELVQYGEYIEFYDALIRSINKLDNKIWVFLDSIQIQKRKKSKYKYLDEYFWMTLSKGFKEKIEIDISNQHFAKILGRM